ncbi:uncharacterized protein C8Q71DRAFT_859896 [Rhodofomes roseus]|uniref:Uncharacterized protein n=1 Tax=Rhodofomes roseus TaxID=34475 RepID=A0ABQ8KAE8_9APHY|nr:uncharacterized protein C8Q71DRAFT_859896 [Rhodofomes roseus]KAH9834239.1 hypothetical protein C8Q71DRAFT_859896 [Rhodofomes roseus]
MQAYSSIDHNTDSDNSSYGSDKIGSGPSVRSSQSDYDAHPSMPVDSHLSAVTLYSPDNSFEQDRIKSLTLSDIHYEGSISRSDKARTFARGVPKPLLTAKFKQLLASLPINAGELHWVSECFTKICQLQLEWQSVGYKGFVTKDVTMGEHLYNILLKTLDKIWESGEGEKGDEGDEGRREHQRWMAFLRCIRVDYWPREHKAVVIAPLFVEEKAYIITNTVAKALGEYEPIMGAMTALHNCRRNYHVNTEDVWCRLMYNALRLDAIKSSHAEACPFFCITAQTAEEFMYETKKMALIVKSGKLGRTLRFIVALVREAVHDIEPEKLYKSKALNVITFHTHEAYPASQDIPCPKLECRVLFYTSGEIVDFVRRAETAVTLEDWERSSNFMWLTGYSTRVASTLPELAWKEFNRRAEGLIHGYRTYVYTTGHFHRCAFNFEVEPPPAADSKETKKTVANFTSQLYKGLEYSLCVVAQDAISLEAGLGRTSVNRHSMGLGGDGCWRYRLFV